MRRFVRVCLLLRSTCYRPTHRNRISNTCALQHTLKQLARPLPLTHGTRGVFRTPKLAPGRFLHPQESANARHFPVRAPAPSTTPQVRLARRNDTFPSRSSRSCFGARRPRSPRASVLARRSLALFRAATARFCAAGARFCVALAARRGRGVLFESCARAGLTAGRARRPGGGVRRRARGSRPSSGTRGAVPPCTTREATRDARRACARIRRSNRRIAPSCPLRMACSRALCVPASVSHLVRSRSSRR